MELPKGAVWMVGIGVLGTIGTGVAYFVQDMPELLSEVNQPTPAPTVSEPVSQATEQQAEQPDPQGTATPPEEPEPPREACRALVNIRVGGESDELPRYETLDVFFRETGRLDVSSGPGLSVYTGDAAYTVQPGLERARGVTHQVVEAFDYTASGPADSPRWQQPNHARGASANSGYILWPVTQQFVRVRSTIGDHVSVHRVLEGSEGTMTEESGATRAIQSGMHTKPLRLNMEALQGRAVGFAHQKVASEQGAQMIWEDFQQDPDGDFMLRLANGPDKSLQPEVGVCCHEREGSSRVVFARLDRGAFALMSPGYLSRPAGYLRGGDGCGELGWDGNTLFARRIGADEWTSLNEAVGGEPVGDVLGMYWLPTDHAFTTENLVEAPEWPTQEDLAREANNQEVLARQAFEAGNYASALERLRDTMRMKLMVGEPVDHLRAMYDEAVLRKGTAQEASKYIGFRKRTAESPAEERRIQELAQEIDKALRKEGPATPGMP